MFFYRLFCFIIAERDFNQKYSRKRKIQATDRAFGRSGELDGPVVTGILFFNVFVLFGVYLFLCNHK